MENIVYVEKYDMPQLNKKEILRYASTNETTEEVNRILDSCINEISPKLVYKVCWRVLPVEFNEEETDLVFVKTESKDIKNLLKNCSETIIFAATVGIEVDRCINRYIPLSPTRALMFQALGAERIESLCNMFCEDIERRRGIKLTPRFSPGYGDFPLEMQKEIFRVLDPSKHIGLSLNNSMLMSPSKSVTAIVGIKSQSV